MSSSNFIKKAVECLLTPPSWIYGGVTWLRNLLFNKGVLHETEFDIPIIGVGNITVGGTGKTPHVEYIVSHLASRYNTAVLSRGYRRKTRGFIEANSKSTPGQIGDEPLQIYQKFGSVAKVAVCESRVKGIGELLRIYPDLELIILDDSFQHRWVKPKVQVLLTDYSRPFYKDRMLPLGRLRESRHNVGRADMVVVTKCPVNLQPLDFRIKTKELDLMKYQKLFFSRYEYGALHPVFADNAPYQASLSQFTGDDAVLLVTGVARPRYFVRHFRDYPFRVRVETFPDHHDFTRSDIQKIRKKFNELPGRRKIIVTTEKDAVRMACNPYFPRELKPFTFYIPVSVSIGNDITGENFITELVKAIESRD